MTESTAESTVERPPQRSAAVLGQMPPIPGALARQQSGPAIGRDQHEVSARTQHSASLAQVQVAIADVLDHLQDHRVETRIGERERPIGLDRVKSQVGAAKVRIGVLDRLCRDVHSLDPFRPNGVERHPA